MAAQPGFCLTCFETLELRVSLTKALQSIFFRYSNIKKKRLRPEQVVHLFDTGDSSFRDEIVEMPAKRAKDGTYRKVPKFLDARNLCCNLPRIQTKRANLKNILSK